MCGKCFSNGMLLPPSLPPHIRTHSCLCVCRFVRVCTEGPLSLSPQPEHPRVPRLHGLGRRRALLILLFLTHPPSQVPLHLRPSLPRRPALTPAQASPHTAKEKTQQETSHVNYWTHIVMKSGNCSKSQGVSAFSEVVYLAGKELAGSQGVTKVYTGRWLCYKTKTRHILISLLKRPARLATSICFDLWSTVCDTVVSRLLH